MSQHQPIRFKEPPLSQAIQRQLREFMRKHPITTSATKVLLGLVVTSGILALTATTPGVLTLWKKTRAIQKREQARRYRRLWTSFYRLKQERALIYHGEQNGAQVYALTEKGQTKLKRFLIDTITIKSPQQWDGYWRVIMFDIPEKRYGKARRALQQRLSIMGCYQLQKSIWVHPFPCEAEVEFVKDFFDVQPYVHMLLAHDMPNGKVLYHFQHLLANFL